MSDSSCQTLQAHYVMHAMVPFSHEHTVAPAKDLDNRKNQRVSQCKSQATIQLSQLTRSTRTLNNVLSSRARASRANDWRISLTLEQLSSSNVPKSFSTARRAWNNVKGTSPINLITIGYGICSFCKFSTSQVFSHLHETTCT